MLRWRRASRCPGRTGPGPSRASGRALSRSRSTAASIACPTRRSPRPISSPISESRRSDSPMQTAPVNLNLILDQFAKDKGIERSILVQILEESIKTAANKHFGMERTLKAHFDEEKGQIDLFQVLTIVADPTPEIPLPDPVNMIPVSVAHEKGIEVEPGDELDFPIYYRPEDEVEAKAQDDQWGDLLKLKTFRRSFGRIAAQTAKQVMIQGTRNAERENIYNEYKDRKGEVITGIVRRFERGNVIVDLGRAEAVLPVREQLPRESYRAGDRIQAFTLDVLR